MGYRTKKANKSAIYDKYHTFDEFVKNVNIPEKYWKFFQHFIDEKSETFGNALKSYLATGYTNNTTSKYRARALYESALVQRLLTLYHQKTAEKRINRDISVFDATDNSLLWCIERAKLAGDYKAVESAAMSRAKLHGQLIDKHQVIDPIAELNIAKTKKLEAAKLAETRLLADNTGHTDNAINAEFEPVNAIESADCTTETYNEQLETAILDYKP